MEDEDLAPVELDFQFNITFPPETFSIDDSERIWARGPGEKEVLVILLGWVGADDKALEKYSDIYLKRGCIVVRYIAPVKVVFWESWKLPLLAARLVKILKDINCETHPTFFHVFSNGGTMVYSYVLRELAAQEQVLEKVDLRGTIFDSCPAPRNIPIVFRAFANVMGKYGNMGLRWGLAGLLVFLLVLQSFWVHLRVAASLCTKGDVLENLEPTMKVRRKEEIPLQNWLRRITHLKNHKFLFLYSDADELIPVEQIEKLAGILQSNGNRVQLARFKGSPHVQHFRRYPEDYIRRVTIFIQRILREEKRKIGIHWRD